MGSSTLSVTHRQIPTTAASTLGDDSCQRCTALMVRPFQMGFEMPRHRSVGEVWHTHGVERRCQETRLLVICGRTGL